MPVCRVHPADAKHHTDRANVACYGTGGASWIGYTLISGHWYGAGGAVVNTSFLNATGTQVGDTFTFTGDGRSATLKITGEVFYPRISPLRQF
ncbi:MAG: hypothetical protein ACRDOE_21555 [Streptosporangiaceae bacterium]